MKSWGFFLCALGVLDLIQTSELNRGRLSYHQKRLNRLPQLRLHIYQAMITIKFN